MQVAHKKNRFRPIEIRVKCGKGKHWRLPFLYPSVVLTSMICPYIFPPWSKQWSTCGLLQSIKPACYTKVKKWLGDDEALGIKIDWMFKGFNLGFMGCRLSSMGKGFGIGGLGRRWWNPIGLHIHNPPEPREKILGDMKSGGRGDASPRSIPWLRTLMVSDQIKPRRCAITKKCRDQMKTHHG